MGPVELWFTPSDFAPSYRVRVTGDTVELLYVQDIWPGYPGAKNVTIEQHHRDYIERPEVKATIIAKAASSRPDAEGEAGGKEQA